MKAQYNEDEDESTLIISAEGGGSCQACTTKLISTLSNYYQIWLGKSARCCSDNKLQKHFKALEIIIF